MTKSANDKSSVFFLPNHCSSILETKAAGMAPMGGPLTIKRRKTMVMTLRKNLHFFQSKKNEQNATSAMSVV